MANEAAVRPSPGSIAVQITTFVQSYRKSVEFTRILTYGVRTITAIAALYSRVRNANLKKFEDQELTFHPVLTQDSQRPLS